MRITQRHFRRVYTLLWEHFQLLFFSSLFDFFFCYLCFSPFSYDESSRGSMKPEVLSCGEEKRGVVSINSNKPFQMIDINVFDFSHAFGKGLSCQSPLSNILLPFSFNIQGRGRLTPMFLKSWWQQIQISQFFRNMLVPCRAEETEKQQSVCRHYSWPAGPKGPEVNFLVLGSPPWALYPLCFWGLLRKSQQTQNNAVWPLRPKETNNWIHSSPSTVLLRRV